jgi:hypothetical protein
LLIKYKVILIEKDGKERVLIGTTKAQCLDCDWNEEFEFE